MTIANINQEIRDICEGDSNTNLLGNTTLLRRVNQAYEEVAVLVRNVAGKWQWDDSNFTDFPIGIDDLVDGQQDYAFASDVLEVEGVSILDSSGNWVQLDPIDLSEMGEDPAEFYKNDGLPRFYDKQGNSLLLYPAPSSSDVTTTNGLKVFFRRTADVYTSAEVTTGTKEPGFASPFHVILAYKASLPWCASYLPQKVGWITTEIGRLEKGIKEHYGRREQDTRKVITMSGISFR